MRFVCAALVVLGLQGCFFDNRQAGTEVGNPEIVSARVALIPASGWDMRSFPVKVNRILYHGIQKDSGVLWNRSGGTFVDAADSTANRLQPQRIVSSLWESASVELAFPSVSVFPADTSDWNVFKDSGLAAFSYASEKLLFAMPDTLRVRLVFDTASIRVSAAGDSISITAWFDCRTWIAAMGQDSLAYRPGGGTAGPFAVLSASENIPVYGRLLDSIPAAFKTDSL